MLEGLDKIDWKQKGCEDIPKYLWLLLSQRQQERAVAHNYFQEHVIKINHQNYDEGYGISELLADDVPILVVPFLLEIVAVENLLDKARVLDMLIGLALYSNMNYEGDSYKNKAQQLHEMIFTKIEIFLKLLEDDDALVRASAFSLLLRLPVDEVLRKKLTKIAKSESNKETQAFMVRMLERT